MTGGEGSTSRGGTAKSATATRPRGTSKGSFSSKRKAAKDPAPSRSSSRPCATQRKAKDVEQHDDATTELSDEQIDKFRRLSKSDIRWLLSLKPMKPPARFAALKRMPRPGEEDTDEDKRRLYRLAKVFFELEENLPATQAWVRGELRMKGYVEVDEERARHRAEVQALVDRKWPAIEEKMKSLFLDEKEEDKGSGEEWRL